VRRLAARFLVASLALGVALSASADVVTLKNGGVYKGMIDAEDTLVSVFDGMTRVVVRDTKIARIEKDAEPKAAGFPLVQPMDVHVGSMPPFAYNVRITPWDQYGRRTFKFVGSRSGKAVEMIQAINGLGPKVCQVRGVDGFWKGQVPTSTVPKEVVLGLLKKVDQANKDSRIKVNSFLMQAEWYDEAIHELARLGKDFPDMAEPAATTRKLAIELSAAKSLAEIKRRQTAQQPRDMLSRLKAFPSEGAATTTLVEVRTLLRRGEADRADATSLADEIRKVGDALPVEARKGIEPRIVEILAALAAAPDAVIDRLAPFRKAENKRKPPEARLALATSGWAAGAEGAVDAPKAADALWDARKLLSAYLASTGPADGLVSEPLAALKALDLADPEKPGSTKKLDYETVNRLARLLPPPTRDPRDEVPGRPTRLRVRDDPNPEQPTEYALWLPPEYHPLRSYPAVVALHDGGGPESAVEWWAPEAARRGYIVVAPEYNLKNQPKDYRYSADEHAAVTLALRDARRRFAVDGDRVYLGGQLLGANMVWDYGLAHPDLFAGIVAISGLPAKFAWAYEANAKRLPILIVEGDLIGDMSTAKTGLIFEYAKKMMGHNWDVTYVEHYQRGLEDFPEDAVAAFDWMDRRRRDPYPKDFDAVTCRPGDARFYGAVVGGFLNGRALTPEQVDPIGKVVGDANGRAIKPCPIDVKIKAQGTLVAITTSGLQQLDLWLSPKVVDFTKKLEIRANGNSTRGQPTFDLATMLGDLRARGDRQQTYAAKVSVTLSGRPR